ncbi:hypothetical protein SAMN05443144_11522 [Fodinibius roseus]|uniref:Uncharacterized protein n=1 Tax=Fodinibius roseus TaxID=1194090 RepID=A0A1M5FGP7_9BACT|nr:hypothetical protein [Fodinibius roseus]SHF90664.1 hypothetical protein SAMN05443144_11522 [Fodinibius roseus]
MNEAGHLLINKEPATLSSVDRLTKKFLSNNEESANITESPGEAIITIKTAKKTPRDTYISVIDKIMGVYEEVRNQASMELFDKPYKALEEGSEERKITEI